MKSNVKNLLEDLKVALKGQLSSESSADEIKSINTLVGKVDVVIAENEKDLKEHQEIVDLYIGKCKEGGSEKPEDDNDGNTEPKSFEECLDDFLSKQ